MNNLIYSLFKIFPRFWLVKATRIIHHNQLLFTKLERIFAILNQWSQKYSPPKIIEPMTSKWRQKCSLLQIIEPLTEKTWGQGCVIFGERKNKERNGQTPLGRRKYLEWIIKCRVPTRFWLFFFLFVAGGKQKRNSEKTLKTRTDQPTYIAWSRIRPRAILVNQMEGKRPNDSIPAPQYDTCKRGNACANTRKMPPPGDWINSNH